MTAERARRRKGSQTDLSERQRKAIDALAAGMTRASAARVAGCAETTLSEWQGLPAFAEALSETRRKQAEAAEEARLETARSEARAYGSALRSVWTAFTAGAELVARDFERRLKAAKRGDKGVKCPKPSDLEQLAQTIERMRDIDVTQPIAAEDLADMPLQALVDRAQSLRVHLGGKPTEPEAPVNDPSTTSTPANGNGHTNGNGEHAATG